MSLFRIQALKRHEQATLSYSYAGEVGRGAFLALCRDFALLVAVSHFGITGRGSLWFLSSAGFVGFMLAGSGASAATKWRKKSVIRSFEVISRLLVVLAAFATTGRAFVLTMGLGIAVNTMSVPLISGLYGANFRQPIRGRAVGRLQAVAVGTTALTGVVLGVVMELDTRYFRGLLATVSLISLACAWYTWRLPESRPPAANSRRIRLRDFVHVLTHDRAFLYLEVYWFIVGLSNLWLMPIRVLYLTEIGFSDRQVMLATTTAMYATMVLSVGLWGRVLYTFNFARYRMLTSAFFIGGILVFFHSTSPAFVCAGSVLWALGLAGGTLSWRLVATFFTTPSRVALYMAIHTFCCGVRGIVGPYLSLRLHDACSARFVMWLSVAGMAFAIAMLVPFAPVVERRQKAVQAETDAERERGGRHTVEDGVHASEAKGSTEPGPR